MRMIGVASGNERVFVEKNVVFGCVSLRPDKLGLITEHVQVFLLGAHLLNNAFFGLEVIAQFLGSKALGGVFESR